MLYEELVAYPRELAQELLEFVGLPWEDGVMEFHKAERVVATASVTQVCMLAVFMGQGPKMALGRNTGRCHLEIPCCD